MRENAIVPRRGGGTRLAVLGLVIANVALACGPWMVRLAKTESQIGPVAAGFWRMVIALPFLVALTLRGRPQLPPRPAPLIGLALLSGLFFAADLGMWHVGILHTRLANATLLGNITAILFPVYGFLVARRWPSRHQGIALVLAAAGAVLLMGRSYELSAKGFVGDLLCIAAGISYTAYLVVIVRPRAALGPMPALTLSVAANLPVLLVAALAMGEPIWPHDWTPLIVLTFGSQLIGQGLILYAVGRLPPLIVGLMLLIQPMVAAALGWVLYREHLSGLDALGAGAIAAAMLLARDTPPLKRPPEGLGSPA